MALPRTLPPNVGSAANEQRNRARSDHRERILTVWVRPTPSPFHPRPPRPTSPRHLWSVACR